jgi:hypothetical protein
MQPFTSVFHGYLAVVGNGGTVIADQSTVLRLDRRFGLMRSERKKCRQRHHCARRNQKDCVLSHPGSVRPMSDFSNTGLLQ